MRFEVLGPVRAWRDDEELDLGFPQQRALLALLLADTGRPVPTSGILDVLWAERPPASALNVVRRYVGALRRLLEPELPPRAPGSRLLRRPGGYLLEADPDEVDLLRFRELTRQGKRAVATGRAETAARCFTEALGQWRGPVVMGIPPSAREHVRFTAVERELLHTTRLAADAALLCGRAEHVLPALRRAAALDPLDEPLHARLILSLAACGLQAEALTAYEDVRRRLSAELGVAPGAELAAAQTRVLRQDVGRLRAGPTVALGRDLPVVRVGPARGASSPAPVGRPAQLPPDPAAFAGRRAELEWLTSHAGPADAGTEAPPTVLIGGMAGVGKTTLAVHWAHRAAHRFPDGQLHVRLEGSDPVQPAVPPEEALRGMLTALGVPAPRMPDGLAALTGLYRTLLAGRRVLVVLDDAAGTEQLRPLLPAAPGCLALVTSRHALPGLIASGARPLRLDPPPAEDARAALALLTGADRPAAEPRAADEIVTRCGRLPLALAAVAARAAARRDLSLATVAAELRASHGSLAAFCAPGATPDVRAAFLGSYRLLSAQSARLFRLLPRHTGPGLTPAAAAALAGLPVRRVRLLLAEIADAHLLTEHTPGRYTMHDLLRAYAAELAAEEGVRSAR